MTDLISPRPSKPSTPSQSTYPRGILKSGNSTRSTKIQLPDITHPISNFNEQHESSKKKANFDENEFKYEKEQMLRDNQMRILRYRRWSNPENRLTRTRKKEARSPTLATTGSSFSPYGFYVDKFNDNNALITESQKKRMELDPKSESLRNSLRRGYRSHTSPSHMDAMIDQWMQNASRNRQRYLDMTVGLGTHRNIFSAGSLLSKGSMAFPLDVREDTLSRKESFLSRASRRISNYDSSHHSFSSTCNSPRRVRNMRWYCRVVKAICGIKMEMQRLSISKTQQTNLSEILYISSGARAIPNPPSKDGADEGQFLLFDKSLFARGRARSLMPMWAQSLMIEPPHRRPSEMVHRLRQLLMCMKSFRENINEDMRHTVCQVVRYTKCDKGRVILRQGHWGFDFYFIFSGSVFIQLEVHDDKTGHSYSSIENVLKSGEGFGEIALLGDGKRTASVICKEPTELCQIDKATFMEICPALFNELLQEKIVFARQFPVFRLWDEETLKKLCFFSQVLEVPHSTVLETDWGHANFAYFVMKGRINLVKSFDATDIETASSQERSLGQVAKVMKVMLVNGEKAKHTKYAKVGTLSSGRCTDLSILSIKPRKDIPQIILQSHGVKVFRVAVRIFHRMSPRKTVEEYLKKMYEPPTFPSSEELRARYHLNISWAEFKRNVVNTSYIENSHQDIATIPATLKGTTGWAKWPGYILRPKNKMAPKFAKDRIPSPSENSFLDFEIFSDGEYTSSDEDSDNDGDDDDGDGLKRVAAVNNSSHSNHLIPWKQSMNASTSCNEKPVNDRSLTISPPSYRSLAAIKKSLQQRSCGDLKSL